MMAPTKLAENVGNNEFSIATKIADGESYECNGELDYKPFNEKNSESSIVESRKRNGWLNTSLRRSHNRSLENSPNRRWGSFRGPKHKSNNNDFDNSVNLDRSSSFHSSDYNSFSNETYSDESCNEEIHELSQKVDKIHQRVELLTDSAASTDDRYAHIKAENATLQLRIHILEEQIRDEEIRSKEKLQEEQRRFRETITRIEREKQLEMENLKIKLQNYESEISNLRDEVNRQKVINEKLKQEKRDIHEHSKDVEQTLAETRVQLQAMKDNEKRQQSERELFNVISKEIESLRTAVQSPPPALVMSSTNSNSSSPPESLQTRLEELQNENEYLKNENKLLNQSFKELQSELLQRTIEQSQFLLSNGHYNGEDNSLAAELEAMSQNQLQQALKEQQEVNAQLRLYLDEILLNAMNNYPQLLEVKHKNYSENIESQKLSTTVVAADLS